MHGNSESASIQKIVDAIVNGAPKVRDSLKKLTGYVQTFKSDFQNIMWNVGFNRNEPHIYHCGCGAIVVV